MRSGDQSAFDFRSRFSVLKDSFLTLVYPHACKICEKSVESADDGFICGKCWRNTHIFKGKEILCHKCGAFLKTGVSTVETFCRRCNADEYDSARAVGIYENALAISVLNLKKEPFLPKRLQKLLISAFENSSFQDTTRLIPVPLSKKRLVERGYNQAAIIARIISKQIKIPLDDMSLARSIHTYKHRVGMDRKARGESVKNAFEVKRPRLTAGENILLVDDVFTSGATVSNCAKVLKESGANKVYVLTIARAAF
jgi:ComF family protein